MECNGLKIITEKCKKQIDALRVHMSRGCLSDIPPGAGTNRIEALHKTINPHFRQSRIGIALSVALLSILLYHHNCKKSNTTIPRSRLTQSEYLLFTKAGDGKYNMYNIMYIRPNYSMCYPFIISIFASI